MDEGNAAAESAGARSLRILVVDDNADITESLSILLEILGHQVAVENQASAALIRVARQPFDVCLLDMNMPEMDGLTLARRIRASVPAPQPALVAITGFGEASDRQAALDAGFNRFLVKPLTTSAMTAVLDELAPGGGTRR
jgi:CheY-like chemotaxis protein